MNFYSSRDLQHESTVDNTRARLRHFPMSGRLTQSGEGAQRRCWRGIKRDFRSGSGLKVLREEQRANWLKTEVSAQIAKPLKKLRAPVRSNDTRMHTHTQRINSGDRQQKSETRLIACEPSTGICFSFLLPKSIRCTVK